MTLLSKLLLILVAVGSINSCATSTQARSLRYEVVWNRSLAHNTYQLPNALIRLANGGYAIAGSTSVKQVPEGVGGGEGFWAVKFDPQGKVQWQRAFAAVPPKRDEIANTVVETRDHGLLLVGDTHSDSLAGRSLGQTNDPRSPPSGYIGFAVKYSEDGAFQLKRVLGEIHSKGKPGETFYSSIMVRDGYVMAGTTDIVLSNQATPSGGRLVRALRVLKLDGMGNIIWDRTIPDGESSIENRSVHSNVSTKIIPTDNDGFVLAIAPTDNGYRDERRMDVVDDSGKIIDRAPLQRAVILKFDRDGHVTKRADLSASSTGIVIAANANGYLISGYYGVLWYAFLDYNLNLKWRKAIAPAMKINALLPARDGGFYGVGASSQVAIAHISSAGDFRQQLIADMPDDSEGRDVVPGDRPDELVILWSRIAQTRAGLVKIRASKD